MPELKPGGRLKSAVCTTEAIVVKAPAGDVDVRCGGVSMIAPDATADGGSVSPDHSGGSLLGKRYVDADETIELLCTKAGEGSLSIGDVALGLKEAKPLPASD
jgi:hypothetical protein